LSASPDATVKGILGDYFKRVLEEGYCEIYVSHDVDSVAAASMVIRMLSAHNIETGIYPAALAHQVEVGERSLVIGSRPPKLGGGVAISRRREGITKIGGWAIAYTASSISHGILDALSQIYQLPRELRSIAVAGHMSSFTKGLLSQVDDRVVSSLGEIFGTDSVVIKEGLKIMGYGAEDDLARVLENSLDPYLPGVSGNRKRASELASQIPYQADREALKAASKALNDALGYPLVSVGLKPVYRENHPFADPYEAHMCILAHMHIGPSEVAAALSTGLQGLSRISYRCLYAKKDLLAYLAEVFDKSKKVSTYSIKGKIVTVYPKAEVSIIWPVHKILSSLSHYQGIAVYETASGYAIPIEGSYDPQALKGLKVLPSGLLLVEDADEIPEVVGVIGV